MDEVSRLRERERGLLIGICTNDFSSLHDIIKILKERGIPHSILGPDAVWETGMDCLILGKGTSSPNFTLKRPPLVELTSNPGDTVNRAVAASFGRERPDELIAGVDPGKRPGVAFIADGILISAIRSPGASGILEIMLRARRAFTPRDMLVRIGDGEPDLGRSIISDLRNSSFKVELVDESQTTRTKKFRDENAAVLIARTRGKPA